MGMYNEVYKRCPQCNRLCVLQISQIILGFGEFNLDDPDSLAERLDEDQLRELNQAVLNKTFWCIHSLGGCNTEFSAFGNDKEDRKALARKLFGVQPVAEDCPCCGYPNCGHEDHNEP